mgnify:FL=1
MKKFIILLFLGGAIVLFSYSAGNYLGLESRKVWLISNVLHFLGGIYTFFFIGSIFNVTKKYHNTSATPVMKAVIFIFGALFLGVLWEWYELFFIYWDKVFILNKQSALVYVDTMGDLSLDLAGAFLASFYYLYKESWKK